MRQAPTLEWDSDDGELGTSDHLKGFYWVEMDAIKKTQYIQFEKVESVL